MKLLLDTQILLWVASIPKKLPTAARLLIERPENQLIVSAASIWEVAIKRGLGRHDFTADPHLLRRGMLESGYEELAISGSHAAAVNLLPPIHKDPFDRILIAQAQMEGLRLLTSDHRLAQYPGPIELV